jgi:predicted nucleic acid-binding protein
VTIRLYLDTNVLCRPFDDQSIARIRKETEAFGHILERITKNDAVYFTSDILIFEIQKIISPAKKAKVLAYLDVSRGFQATSEKSLVLADEIMRKFKLKPRDALHASSGLLGGAQYFLSCDDGVTRTFRRKPLSLVVENNVRSLEIMNPESFVEKMRW